MLRPKIRWANPSEGPQVEKLLLDNYLCPRGVDWSSIEGWMVATHRDTIIGAIQVLPGKPLGHIGFLVVNEAQQNSGAGYFLWKAAERWLGHQGIDGYTGMTSNPVVKKAVIKSNGIVFGDPVEVVMKRVKK